jgi:hypothetical protein
MDDAIQIESHPDPHPLGLFGLLLSLGAIVLIGLSALFAGMVLVALVDFLLFGWPHLRDSFMSVAGLVQGGALSDLITAGLIIGSAVYVAGSFAIWIMARLRAGKAWPLLLGWTPFKTDRTYWGLLLAAIVYQVGASVAVGYFHPAAKSWFTFPDQPMGIASAIVLVVIMAPLAEELLFRGWIYTALRWRFGYGAALGATAVLFALAHWESSHLYALAILPMGLLLGYLRERTGSTRATTLFHMLYNSAGLVLSFLGKV